MNSFLVLPVAFFLSFIGTWGIIKLATHKHWLDQPNERSSHVAPTPTGGGVAFVLVFSAVAIFAFSSSDPGFNLFAVIVLSVAIMLLGLFDDIYNLGIRSRIGSQCLVVAGALALFDIPGIPVGDLVLEPGLAGVVIAALGTLWFINLFNFMDGIDGLAAGEGIFIFLAAAFLIFEQDATGFSLLLLIIASCLCGFFLLNLPPAKIFMGDTGSNFLGFFIAVTALASTSLGYTNIWTWCILPGVFICDATYTLVARMLSGETWYFAHRRHAYQLATYYFSSHAKVLGLVWLINCLWLLPLAWLAHQQSGLGLLLTLIAWFPLFLLAWFIAKTLLAKSTA
ncbi:MAG: glycosyltransferase family 4 protein [Gammaproteobacteria bacterium]